MIGGDSTPGEATLEAASDAVPHESNESLFDTAADDTPLRRESTTGASSASIQEEREVTTKHNASDTKASPQDEDTLPPVILRTIEDISVFSRMPNTGFGIAMGLAGHAIMWNGLLSTPVNDYIGDITIEVFGSICWYLSACAGGVILVCYLYKTYNSVELVRAEWKDEMRSHFFNAPILIYIMLLIGLPPHIDVQAYTLRWLWVLAFILQTFVTHQIYKAWMFDNERNFLEAKPQFLLSTIGWFLLSTLGSKAQIKQEWGIGLPAMCFGAGFILYIDIVIFIFGNLHKITEMKGSPSTFLLIAPPSVGVVALDLLNDGASEFSLPAEMLLGWIMVILLLLFGLAPKLGEDANVFGEFWAYVTPIAAATTATIRYAVALGTIAPQVLAIFMLILAILSLFFVIWKNGHRWYQEEHNSKDEEKIFWADRLFDMKKFNSPIFSKNGEKREPEPKVREENQV